MNRSREWGDSVSRLGRVLMCAIHRTSPQRAPQDKSSPKRTDQIWIVPATVEASYSILLLSCNYLS